MTAEIIAERLTDRRCVKHPDVQLVEVIFRSDKLENDWLLRICPSCRDEAEANMADEESQ